MPLKQEQASPERPRCMGGANEHWGFKNPVMKERTKNMRQEERKMKKSNRERILLSMKHWHNKGRLQPKKANAKIENLPSGALSLTVMG